MKDELALRESIEEYRQSMYKLAKEVGNSHPDVVKISQQLDIKIIMLQKIMYVTQSPSIANSHFHDENKLNSVYISNYSQHHTLTKPKINTVS